MAVFQERELRIHLAEKLAKEPGRYLVRGQNRRYETAAATLARCSGEKLGQAYTLLCHLVGRYRNQMEKGAFRGLLPISVEQSTALLQHFGWPTPYLDLTDSTQVAFFFANQSASLAEPAVIFLVDTTKLDDSVVLVRHDEVMDPALNLRWSRQRGYALRPVQWRDMESCRKLDLLQSDFAEFYEFRPSMSETLKKDSLSEYLADDDEVADQLRFLVAGLADLLEFKPLHPELARFPY